MCHGDPRRLFPRWRRKKSAVLSQVAEEPQDPLDENEEPVMTIKSIVVPFNHMLSDISVETGALYAGSMYTSPVPSNLPVSPTEEEIREESQNVQIALEEMNMVSMVRVPTPNVQPDPRSAVNPIKEDED